MHFKMTVHFVLLQGAGDREAAACRYGLEMFVLPQGGGTHEAAACTYALECLCCRRVVDIVKLLRQAALEAHAVIQGCFRGVVEIMKLQPADMCLNVLLLPQGGGDREAAEAGGPGGAHCDSGICGVMEIVNLQPADMRLNVGAAAEWWRL